MGILLSGGDDLAAMQPGAFWAKITGSAAGTNRYAWTQIDTGDTAAFDTGLSDDFAATGTSAATGAPAYEVNGRTGVATGTRVLLYPAGDLTFYIFASPVTGSGATASGADSCGWTAGADTDTCLRMTVVSAQGKCSGIDTTQSIELIWDGGDSRYESGASDFTGTGSGGTGLVTLDVSGAAPTSTIDGVSGKYMGCSGDGGLLFAFGGSVLCGGTAGTCDNYFVVRFDCECCSIAWWDGEGWYCVDGVATYLTEDDRCDDAIVIDSGPYATEELAEADCPPGITTTCCPDDPVPQTLNWTITGKTGTCSCAPTSGTVTYDAINEMWSSVDFSCLIGDCEENASNSLKCVSGTWRYDSGVPTGSGLAPTSVTCNPLSIVFDKTIGGGSYTITFTA